MSGAEHAADVLPQLEEQVEAGPVVGGASSGVHRAGPDEQSDRVSDGHAGDRLVVDPGAGLSAVAHEPGSTQHRGVARHLVVGHAQYVGQLAAALRLRRLEE